MPPLQQEVTRGHSFCPLCKCYTGLTESEEIKELKGIIATQSAELRKREKTVMKLQRDLQQAEADKAEPESIYKHMERVAKLPEKPSQDVAASGTKNRESREVFVESTTVTKQLQDTLQQSQEGVTMGFTMKKGLFFWQNKGGAIGQEIGEGKRQADEFVSETTAKLNTRDSGVVDSESKHHDIEQALNRIEQKMDRYHDEVHRGRTEVEAITSEWKHPYASCSASVARITDDRSRITALETRNHDLEEAFVDLKKEASRVTTLESRNHELEREVAVIKEKYRHWTEANSNLESRNRELEQALNETRQKMEQYRNEAHTERSKAESTAGRLKVWERQHSSCTDRITALETAIRELEEVYNDLESKYSHVQRIHSACGDELARLTEEATRVTALESRNHELQRELAITQEKYKQWKAEANTSKWHLQEAQRVYSSRVQELQHHIQDHIQDQKQKAQSARQRAEQLKDAFEELQQIHTSTTEYLDARTKQLTFAQQFLSTADLVAGAEVIQSVRNAQSMESDTNSDSDAGADYRQQSDCRQQ